MFYYATLLINRKRKTLAFGLDIYYVFTAGGDTAGLRGLAEDDTCHFLPRVVNRMHPLMKFGGQHTQTHPHEYRRYDYRIAHSRSTLLVSFEPTSLRFLANDKSRNGKPVLQQ